MVRTVIIAALAATTLASPALASYKLTDLVTDDQSALTALGYAPAAHVDPNLVNPWGIDRGPTGGWEVADAPTGKLTFYSASGASTHSAVTVPQALPNPMGPPTGATGLVHNSSSDFALPGGGAATVIVANLDGSISGWNAAAGGTAVKMVPGLADGNVAIYTGLANGASGGNNYIYAANDITGQIDVYDKNWTRTTLAGSFTNPGANPDGLVPYNIQNLGGKLWVTYAIPGPDSDEAPLGQGFVSVFNTDGTFDRRFATGGPLLSPWALTLAPSDFGAYSNDVLIGNFSSTHDAYINAYRPDGTFAGTLNSGGTPISLPGLWGIEFGNGAGAGATNTLYAAAGIGDEQHGLFGSIAAVPEPASWALMLGGFAAVGTMARRRRTILAAA